MTPSSRISLSALVAVSSIWMNSGPVWVCFANQIVFNIAFHRFMLFRILVRQQNCNYYLRSITDYKWVISGCMTNNSFPLICSDLCLTNWWALMTNVGGLALFISINCGGCMGNNSWPSFSYILIHYWIRAIFAMQNTKLSPCNANYTSLPL